MRRLCEIYRVMFGRVATVSTRSVDNDRTHGPGGPAIVWFAAFFRKLSEHLEKQPHDDLAGIALLGIAQVALSSRANDAIAGWLRDVRRKPKNAID